MTGNHFLNGQQQAVLDNALEEDSPLFLVGAPRSGTSLLGRIVGLSPTVSIFEETGLFSLVYARRNPFRACKMQRDAGIFVPNPFCTAFLHACDRLRGINRLRNLLQRMLEYTRIGEYDLNPGEGLNASQGVHLKENDANMLRLLHRKYESLMQGDFGDVVGVLLRDYRLLAGKEKIAEKTPTHFLYLPLIFSKFPGARVVFISRDRKEVIASYVDTFKNRHISWRQAVKYIHALHCRAQKVAALYSDHEHVLQLAYDDLMTSPPEAVRRIYEFLEVAPPTDLAAKLAVIGKTPSRWQKLTDTQRRRIEKILR